MKINFVMLIRMLSLNYYCNPVEFMEDPEENWD